MCSIRLICGGTVSFTAFNVGRSHQRRQVFAALVEVILDRNLLRLLDLLALLLRATSPLVLAFLTVCRKRSTRFLFDSHSCGESVDCTAVGGMLALTCAMAHRGRVFWYCESGVR